MTRLFREDEEEDGDNADDNDKDNADESDDECKFCAEIWLLLDEEFSIFFKGSFSASKSCLELLLSQLVPLLAVVITLWLMGNVFLLIEFGDVFLLIVLPLSTVDLVIKLIG